VFLVVVTDGKHLYKNGLLIDLHVCKFEIHLCVIIKLFNPLDNTFKPHKILALAAIAKMNTKIKNYFRLCQCQKMYSAHCMSNTKMLPDEKYF